MWPTLLDMTKEESVQCLRNLELEAYSHLVSALRAQGPLSSDKRKLLKESSLLLNISQDRHKAEVRRAVSDEKLNTIAYHISGQNESMDDWAQEGCRIIPLLPRIAPQTAYSVIADDAADNASQNNKQLPSPSATERKRQPPQQFVQTPVSECNKPLPFRIPDLPKAEECKKRKLTVTTENSTLAQHLLGPSKMSKIQQIYRQRTKAKTKEQLFPVKFRTEPEKQDMTQQRIMQQQIIPQKLTSTKVLSLPVQGPSNGPKINVLQNITLPSPQVTEIPVVEQYPQPDAANFPSQRIEVGNLPISPVGSNENLGPPRPKIVTNLKSNANLTFKPTPTTSPGPSIELPKTLKMCPTRKPISKPVTQGQKLIVVSNAQTIPTTSILQRTLTIPFMKNISVKNFEKFKIVTSTPAPSSIQVSTVTNSTNINSMKHKVVTVRTNSTTKKVIPLSQLQVLNSKGSIKVLPIGGKIVGKASTSTTSSPMYIMNSVSNVHSLTKSTPCLSVVSSSRTEDNIAGLTPLTSSSETIAVPENTTDTAEGPSTNLNRENGKSSVLEDILKASGVLLEQAISSDFIPKEEENPENHCNQVISSTVVNDEIKLVDASEKMVEPISVPMISPKVENEIKQEEGDLMDEVIKSELANEVIEAETSPVNLVATNEYVKHEQLEGSQNVIVNEPVEEVMEISSSNTEIIEDN